MRQRSSKPDWQQKIAKERIDILFDLAEKNLNKNLKRSQRYVELARKIGTRYNVRFSKEMKRKFCKNCNTLLKGTKIRVRTEGKSLIIKCLNCNKLYRYPYR
jgi:ribonuclease P protein subunit RPR2